MRVLVCGGRDFTDYHAVRQVLDDLWEHEAGRHLVVIHGAARGADKLAQRWAQLLWPHEGEEMAFPADWKRYGKGAGVIRNQQMLDEGKPDLVIAFPGGKGTADLVRRAEVFGIPVRRPA